MSYVFMKALEGAPGRYERGMRLLTLGRLNLVRGDIVAQVWPGQRVLDIGCGTGALMARLAARGAHVTGADISPAMLELARQTVAAQERDVPDGIQIREMSAVSLDTAFDAATFDVIVSVLTFSEMQPDEVDYVLDECRRLLKPDGLLMIADEVAPASPLLAGLTFLLRLPFVVLTFILTQNTTRRIARLGERIQAAGFRLTETRRYLLGSLQLFIAEPET
jgi:cyclopropane fatty-acyl-phospholipid synthase-like methyltransferase